MCECVRVFVFRVCVFVWVIQCSLVCLINYMLPLLCVVVCACACLCV